jgi:hypothetical protein
MPSTADPNRSSAPSRRESLPWHALAWWAALLLAGVALAWLIHDRANEPLAPDALGRHVARLQPLLAGEEVEVPAADGIWIARHKSADVVVLNAEPVGAPQRIDLCEQRTHPRDPASTIYPLSVVASLPAGRPSTQTARNPLVLGPAAGVGMPDISLRGRGSGPPDRAELRLVVGEGKGESPDGGRWQVAGAAAGSGGYLYRGAAWIAWSPPGAPPAAPGAAPRHFDHALQLRTVADADCPAGAVEWRLFRAGGAPSDADAAGAGEDPGQRLWVLPTAADAAAPFATRLPAGRHTIPAAARAPIEDRALFEHALAQGALAVDAQGRIRLAADNGADPVRAATVKRLRDTAAGRLVLAEVERYNAARSWVAVRARAADPRLRDWFDSPQAWQASSATLGLLAVQRALPDVAVRLSAQPQNGWSRWVRIVPPAPPPLETGDEAAATVFELTLKLPDARSALPPEIELQVLGSVLAIQGTRLRESVPDCGGPGCSAPDVLKRLRLVPQPGATHIALRLAPEPRFMELNPTGSERLRIQRSGGRLAWIDPPRSAAPPPAAAVRIAARDGTELFAEDRPSAAAAALGIDAVVGMGRRSATGAAGTLERLAAQRLPEVQARLSIDVHWQALVQAILECVGQRQGRWDAQGQRCLDPANGIDPRRRAAAVLLDADAGDILSVATGTPVGLGADPAELLAFDRYNAGASPLRIPAWQHDGGVAHAAGSTFKIVTALALEQAAPTNPALATQLGGLPVAQWAGLDAPAGGPFSIVSPCYPARCDGPRAKVHNYRDARPVDAAVDGRLGLPQALRKSLNTWFAFMAERIDRTLPGHADARALGPDALHAERPLLAMAHRLGFDRAAALDGGLLGPHFAWRPTDSLLAMASDFDPIVDAHGVRQMAIGLRMRATPLQMAGVAAAVATGNVVAPRLLIELDGRPAPAPTAQPLGVPLHRVREGMKEVVDSGTAQAAFKAQTLAAVRAGLFAKTGTAPIAGTALNTAWFVGYLRGGTLPGEPRTIAFAVSISHTDKTGGAHAAAVMAAIAQAWLAAAGGR